MKFVRDIAPYPDLDIEVPIYTPVDIEGWRPNAWHMSEVAVEDEVRLLSTRVLRMLGIFRADLRQRCELQQDCFAFGLACESGNPLIGVEFGEGKASVSYDKVAVNGLAISHEPDLSSGQIAFTADALPDDPDFISDKSGIHCLVRASALGEQSPLYASKLGTDGPVVLHGFEDLAELYPFQTAGQISGLRLIHGS